MARRFCYYSLLKRITTLRFLLLISCFSVLTVFWIQSVSKVDNTALEALGIRYFNVYKKSNRHSKDLKYILLWTPSDYSPFIFFESGQQAFFKSNCSVTNCYVTDDRSYFGSDTTGFDAIAFNGRNMRLMRQAELPAKRSPHQKYIFFQLESSDNYPVCRSMFDGFFNWTATYKLDSDIPYPYLSIKDKSGKRVGPRKDMQWIQHMKQVEANLTSKKKAAAWFVSACSDRSGRKQLVTSLQKELEYYGLTVDVFGACGTMECSLENKAECGEMLKRDYYFYLALENSFAEDYVTEKVLTALQHDTVPIVYGAADYSRFLPPGSYLDARELNPKELAALMFQVISSPDQYRQFFNWKQYYTYADVTASDNVCDMCEALNNKTRFEATSVHTDFRRWWNPNYEDRCWWVEDINLGGLWP